MLPPKLPLLLACSLLILFSHGYGAFAQQEALDPLMTLPGERPTWSQDGARILYTINSPDECVSDCIHEVHIADVSGDAPEDQLTLSFEAYVASAQWSADEQLILVHMRPTSVCTDSCEDVISVWDSATGESITLLDDLSVSGYSSVGWTGDLIFLRFLALEGGYFGHGLIQVWNVAGDVVFTYEPQNYFNAYWNQDLLLLGESEAQVRVWNVRDHEQVLEFGPDSGMPIASSWHPDATQLALVSQRADGVFVELWTIEGELIRAIRVADDSSNLKVVWSPDGDYLLTRDASNLTVWELSEGRAVFSQQAEIISFAGWEGDHLLLFADNNVTAYQAPSFDAVMTFTPAPDGPYPTFTYVGSNRDHSLFVVGIDYDPSNPGPYFTTVWNAEGQQVAYLGDQFQFAFMPQFSPTSNRLVGYIQDTQQILVWEIQP